MRTMSLHETGHSSAAISPAGLLDGAVSTCPDPGLVLDDLIELVCRGGWPAALHRSLVEAQQGVRDYLEEIRRTDVHTVDGVRRDPARVRAVPAQARIAAGEFAPGDRLPSIPTLMAHYQVPGLNTIRQAQHLLVEDGLVETRQGVGAFVLRTEPVPRPVDVLAELRTARSALNRAIAALDNAAPDSAEGT